MKEERFDIIIIGGGHNGTTTAAYLAKCGLSVIVLEERPECGGCQETVEPMAGVRIQPHAIANYAGSAPGWEQLELWRYGFRMDWDPNKPIVQAMDRQFLTSEGLAPISQKDIEGYIKITCMDKGEEAFRDLMRATFWCPPHPVGTELDENNIIPSVFNRKVAESVARSVEKSAYGEGVARKHPDDESFYHVR